MEENRILIGLDYSVASKEVIEILIEDAEDPAIFAELVQANVARPEILQLMYDHPETPDEVRNAIAGTLHMPVTTSSEVAKTAKPKEVRVQSINAKIMTLTVSERIQLAMKGNREVRGILVKDSNKEVMLSVLANQRITTTEIELIARSRSVHEEALRRIARNRDWMKEYSIVHGLVTNPKTPPGISMGLIGEIKTKDLIILEKNKNVPEVIRSATKRLLQARKPK